MVSARIRLIGTLSLSLLLASACAGQSAEPSPSPAPAVTTSGEATPSPRTPAVAPVDREHPRSGPAVPKVGTTYPFDLMAHCTGEFTRFGGRFWRTDDPPGNLAPRSDPDGTTRITGYLAGTMQLVDADTARFIIDTYYVDVTDPVVEYHAMTGTPPVCQ
jgi:hypothetical protein